MGDFTSLCPQVEKGNTSTMLQTCVLFSDNPVNYWDNGRLRPGDCEITPIKHVVGGSTAFPSIPVI